MAPFPSNQRHRFATGREKTLRQGEKRRKDFVGSLLQSLRKEDPGTETLCVHIAEHPILSIYFFSYQGKNIHWTEISLPGNMHRRTKIKIAIFVLLVGMACMFTAVVTDYWAVLSPRVDKVNETCEAAHFGLWRLCKKYIYISSENFDQGHVCGPISLPGGKRKFKQNCSLTGR